MTTFEEREKAFENLFGHDQDLLFRIRARRDRLAGLWAAGLMGLQATEAEAYAKEIVDTDFGSAAGQNLGDRLHADLTAAGVEITPRRVAKELDALTTTARTQVMAE